MNLDYSIIQINLFDKIKLQFSSKKKFLNAIKEIIPLQRSALNNRLRGDKLLSLDELVCLAQAFKLDLNKIFEVNERRINFEYPIISSKVNEIYKTYLNQLTLEIESTTHFTNKFVRYDSREVPIFYYFKYPELAYFKILTYQNSTWRHPDDELLKFSPKLFLNDNKYLEIMQRIYNKYIGMNREEYWISHPFRNTIRQILNSIENELFESPSTSIGLLNTLKKMCGYLENIAKQGNSKSPLIPGHFNLYKSDQESNNHTMLFNSSELDIVYTIFQNPNQLKSTDAKIISEVDLWMKRSKQMSQPLTFGKANTIQSYFNYQRIEIDKAIDLANKINAVQALRY